jgi:hypothetical protein
MVIAMIIAPICMIMCSPYFPLESMKNWNKERFLYSFSQTKNNIYKFLSIMFKYIIIPLFIFLILCNDQASFQIKVESILFFFMVTFFLPFSSKLNSIIKKRQNKKYYSSYDKLFRNYRISLWLTVFSPILGLIPNCLQLNIFCVCNLISYYSLMMIYYFVGLLFIIAFEETLNCCNLFFKKKDMSTIIELKKKQKKDCFHDVLRPYCKEKGDTNLLCLHCQRDQKYCKGCNIPICSNCFEVIKLPIPPALFMGNFNKTKYEKNKRVFDSWYSKKLNTNEFKNLQKRGWWVAYWYDKSDKYIVTSSHFKLYSKSPYESVKMKIGEKNKVIIVPSFDFFLEVPTSKTIITTQNFEFLNDNQKKYLRERVSQHFFCKCEIFWIMIT